MSVAEERARLTASVTRTIFDRPAYKSTYVPPVPKWTPVTGQGLPRVRYVDGAPPVSPRPVAGMVKREKAKGTTDELTPKFSHGTLPVRQANRSRAEHRQAKGIALW